MKRIFPEYMKLKEFAAEYISISVSTLKKWIKDGMPVYIPKGSRCIWVKLSEFDEWFKQHCSGTETINLDSIWGEVMAGV